MRVTRLDVVDVALCAERHARLRCALIAAHLKPDHMLSGAQLLVREVASVLGNWLRAYSRSAHRFDHELCNYDLLVHKSH